jgi:hypothetical protein
MSSEGKVRVVVRSRKVPTGFVELHEALYTPSGVRVGRMTTRRLLFDYVLDEDHQRTIQEAHKLARRLCLDLEVVDSSRIGFFGRLVLSLGRRGSASPSIEVSPQNSTTRSEVPQTLVQFRR